ncbi:hypothetical protein D3C76_397560 [compost metagenome]
MQLQVGQEGQAGHVGCLIQRVVGQAQVAQAAQAGETCCQGFTQHNVVVLQIKVFEGELCKGLQVGFGKLQPVQA